MIAKIIFILIIFLSIALFFILWSVWRRRKNLYPYVQGAPLLSAAEKQFYQVLTHATQGDALVFTKVRIADIITPKKTLRKNHWQQAFNRIACKHFDYVLCHPENFSIIAVVELNDKTHLLPRRKKRDRFVRHVCKAANLMLHEFSVKKHYDVNDIKDTIFPKKT